MMVMKRLYLLRNNKFGKVMKTRLCFILSLTVFLCSCQHPDLVGNHHGGGEIAFFQFTDSTLIDKAVLSFYPPLSFKTDYVHSWGETCWVPLYPKNLEGQPIFGKDGYLGTNHLLNWKIGDVYTLEDLINTPKYIALKDGYYICYPFTELVSFGCYVNVDWKDLLTTNMDNVEVCTTQPSLKRYVIHEDELVRLTKKSTMHFKGVKKDMIVIDDVVEVLNKLIETNTIEDHCHFVQRYCN